MRTRRAVKTISYIIVREPVAIKGVPWDFSAEIVTFT